MDRIYLSPPDMSPGDRQALLEALDSGWIAPLGPQVDAFEEELASATGRRHAVALSSGTAALHLALIAEGVGPGDRVAVSSLTFAATANAVRYVGAEPVFIDSTPDSWNMDPDLLDSFLERANGTASAVIAVDLYGQCADYGRIEEICQRHEVTLIEDAAESLGASHRNRPAGSFGESAILSFNGNKIITTSGGGALVTDDGAIADQARFLSTQARDPAPHYEHSQLGYNYRLSNLLAGLGRSQLSDLSRRVETRRRHNQEYRDALGALPGVSFMPESSGNRSTFWLTAIVIDAAEAGFDREDMRQELERRNVEARPVWKPMHLQPLYAGCEVVGGSFSENLFENGLCLPSGSNLSDEDRQRVIDAFFDVYEAG